MTGFSQLPSGEDPLDGFLAAAAAGKALLMGFSQQQERGGERAGVR